MTARETDHPLKVHYQIRDKIVGFYLIYLIHYCTNYRHIKGSGAVLGEFTC